MMGIVIVVAKPCSSNSIGSLKKSCEPSKGRICFNRCDSASKSKTVDVGGVGRLDCCGNMQHVERKYFQPRMTQLPHIGFPHVFKRIDPLSLTYTLEG